MLWFVCALLQADNDFDQLRVQAGSQPRLVRSIEFSATRTMTRKDQRTPETITSKATLKYSESAGCFRAEVSIVDPKTGKKVEVLSLYDGTNYQFVQSRGNDAPTLHKSRANVAPNDSYEMNPLAMPYLFLVLGPKGADWLATRVEDNWSKAFEKAKYEGEIKEKGMTFGIVRFPGPMPNTHYRVFFAKELGYYPLKHSLQNEDGSSVSDVEVTEHKRFETDGNSIIIPLAATLKHGSADAKVTLQCQIDPKSLRVNAPVDKGSFTYPEEKAARVVDEDNLQKKAAAYNAHPWTAIVLVHIVIMAVLLMWYRKRHLTRKQPSSVLLLTVLLFCGTTTGCGNRPKAVAEEGAKGPVIYLGKGLDNAHFGMSKEKVIELLGEPDETIVSPKNANVVDLAYRSKGFSLGTNTNRGFWVLEAMTAGGESPPGSCRLQRSYR